MKKTTTLCTSQVGIHGAKYITQTFSYLLIILSPLGQQHSLASCCHTAPTDINMNRYTQLYCSEVLNNFKLQYPNWDPETFTNIKWTT
jgi:hypothetical protein